MHTTDRLNAALGGAYAIERELGRGGMATVYLARDLKHQRLVALKVLDPELGAVLGAERFLSEIRVTANLQHPNLLPLFDSGSISLDGSGTNGGPGFLYYVMPYVEGETLRHRLDREKQLPIDDAVRIAVAAANALSYAHQHGVIHRDLKPENILLQHGQPVIADFGIALAVSNAGGQRVTQTGLSLGTPQYMSPEQATGDRVIDGRSDIYSLGAVLYEMLTGEPPHTGSSSQAVIARLLTEKPRAIRTTRSNVPEHVEAAVDHVLEKLPADRFASAREFADALTGARPLTAPDRSTGLPITAASTNRFVRLAPWVIALAAIVVAVAPRVGPKPPPPAPARLQVEIPDSVILGSASPGTAPDARVALSRDGRLLVFVGHDASPTPLPASPANSRRLYLRRLVDDVSLPVPGTERGLSPSFSPDGGSLVFIAGVRGTDGRGLSLRTVPVGGGTPRELATDVGASASWSENDEILFVSSRGLEAVPSGGGPRRVVAPASASRIYLFVNALPGSRYALVTYATSGVIGPAYNHLAVVSLADGSFSDLSLQGSGGQYAAPGYLVFTRGAGAGTFAVPFSLRTRRVTGSPVPLIQGVRPGDEGISGIGVSQGGTLAYVAADVPEMRTEMVIVDRAGRAGKVIGEPTIYNHPRLSPDGQRVAVTIGGAAANGAGGVVYVYDVATGAGTRVSPDSNSSRAEWSRDGSRIIYRQTLTDSGLLWSRPWNLSALPSIVARGGVESFYELAVGPPGGWAAIRNGAAGPRYTIPTGIALAPSESLDKQRPLFDHVAAIYGLQVSPNGKLLAYTANEAQQPEVYVTPIPGPGPRVQISLHGGQEPLWSRDGRMLYYRTADRGRIRGVMEASIVEQPTLSVARRDSLFTGDFLGAATQINYDVFPDGRFVMLRSGPDRAPRRDRLFVVVNWPQLIESSKSNGSSR